MPTTDTSEKGLETLIVNSLRRESGYVSDSPSDCDCDRDPAVELSGHAAKLPTIQLEVMTFSKPLRNQLDLTGIPKC